MTRLTTWEQQEQEDIRQAEYDVGFQAGLDGEPSNSSRSLDWLRGWMDSSKAQRVEEASRSEWRRLRSPSMDLRAIK